jgi:hypothetical protein
MCFPLLNCMEPSFSDSVSGNGYLPPRFTSWNGLR